MGTANWLYDTILYVYALSLLFYFSDFMNASRRAKRIGTGLLVFVWVLQTGYLIMRLVSHLDLSQISAFEYWLCFSWLIVTVSLVMSRFYSIDYIVFFVNVVGFAVLALNLYAGAAQGNENAVGQTTRELLYVHISLIVCAYAALTFGALLAGMYMFLHHRLKSKRWSKFVRRYPSLDMIERFSDRAVMIGVPLLAMSLSIAVTSLLVEGRIVLLLDWKVLSSFAALVMFIVYIYQRARNRRTGEQLAKLYLIAFLVLLLNLASSAFSSFH
ncbi:cytochrome c biogenesis protein CcsA [Paenibacillus sp. PAMC21692]|uniref:cytochrome c biogenesis protein CcsA n=1 Tax=Paenibacillus sp. PAMC21692 TaxID=2762320 RepID=UPI00164E6231|nr:cytochrome c biogenesis protein CcsA [Paenibacillus sp. PAMC21692]QNK60014.1 cytochrome c biogenesis protein CcsA [Paenibacillus sp. PAMC21692]